MHERQLMVPRRRGARQEAPGACQRRPLHLDARAGAVPPERAAPQDAVRRPVVQEVPVY